MGAIWAKRKLNSTASKRSRTPNEAAAVERNITRHIERKPIRTSKPEIIDSGSVREESSYPVSAEPSAVGTDGAAITTKISNIRQSLSFDYQRDICKQYFQTGHCRYGDSCKFLHERGDSVKRNQKTSKWRKPNTAEAADSSANDKCFLCDADPPEAPVKPKCGHICCETCFIKQVKSKAIATCTICDQALGTSATSVIS